MTTHGQDRRTSYKLGGCLHGVGRNRDWNRAQGAYKIGRVGNEIETWEMPAEQSKEV